MVGFRFGESLTYPLYLQCFQLSSFNLSAVFGWWSKNVSLLFYSNPRSTHHVILSMRDYSPDSKMTFIYENVDEFYILEITEILIPECSQLSAIGVWHPTQHIKTSRRWSIHIIRVVVSSICVCLYLKTYTRCVYENRFYPKWRTKIALKLFQ